MIQVVRVDTNYGDLLIRRPKSYLTYEEALACVVEEATANEDTGSDWQEYRMPEDHIYAISVVKPSGYGIKWHIFEEDTQ